MVNLLDVAASQANSEDIIPNAGILMALDYLRRKELLAKFDPQEELIFFPEVSV
jgi:hypothetical protein